MLAQAVVIVSVVLAAMPPLATAQAYPAKPIRWISPWPAGGANDIFSRAIGQKIGESLGQQVLVDNRPGAAGTIGSDIAAKAPADGYTSQIGRAHV